MVHCFDTEIAKLYGVNSAILLYNINYWIQHAKANGKNFHDERYWTYNSNKAFQELFPYLSDKQIRKALQNLIEDGVLITGNYNAVAYDRTLWYSNTEKGESILQKAKMDIAEKDKSICPVGKMETPKKENGFSSEGEPIPYINTINNSNIISDINTDKETKHQYGEYKKVLLTDKEIQKLYKDYGVDDTDKAISYLDMYIKEKGYKSKCHYLALKRWVFNAVQERKKMKPVSGYDWDNL